MKLLSLIGVVYAVLLSWKRNHSFLLAIVAAIFGWFYVIYYYFTRDEFETMSI